MQRKSKSQPFDIDLACDQLAELGVKRRQFIQARIKVMNAAGALVRRALGWQVDLAESEQAKISKGAAKIMSAKSPEDLSPDLAAIAEAMRFDIATSRAMAAPGEEHQAKIEKEMRKIAKQFPVWEWAKGVNGLSDLGVAVIISQAGRLDKYSSADKLKKRLGLAPITKDGVTRAASTWRKNGGLTSEDWQDTSSKGPKYSPRRRAQMYAQVGTMIIGGMGKGVRPLVGEDISLRDDWSYYQKEFVRRLRHEVARDPAMGRPATNEGKESFSLHARFMAQRVVEQRLLRDLWKAWRRASVCVSERTNATLPADEITDPLKDGAEATSCVPEKAISTVPPQLITDAAQAAGQATGEMPSSAMVKLPDHLLPDAPQGADEAFRRMPAMADSLLPRQSNVAQAAGEASEPVPLMAHSPLPPHQSSPRPLTQSEIASLRQDAISTSMQMKVLMKKSRDAA